MIRFLIETGAFISVLVILILVGTYGDTRLMLEIIGIMVALLLFLMMGKIGK